MNKDELEIGNTDAWQMNLDQSVADCRLQYELHEQGDSLSWELDRAYEMIGRIIMAAIDNYGLIIKVEEPEQEQPDEH